MLKLIEAALMAKNNSGMTGKMFLVNITVLRELVIQITHFLIVLLSFQKKRTITLFAFYFSIKLV